MKRKFELIAEGVIGSYYPEDPESMKGQQVAALIDDLEDAGKEHAEVWIMCDKNAFAMVGIVVADCSTWESIEKVRVQIDEFIRIFDRWK